MNYELNEEEIKSILERLEEIRTDIEDYKYIYNSTLKTIKDLAEDLEFYKNQLENKKKYNYSTEKVEEKLETIKTIVKKIEDEDLPF